MRLKEVDRDISTFRTSRPFEVYFLFLCGRRCFQANCKAFGLLVLITAAQPNYYE